MRRTAPYHAFTRMEQTDGRSIVHLPTYRKVLPSGLQVIVQPDPTAQVVTTTMVLDGGGQHAGPQEGELAHLIEHLWFSSTQTGTVTVEAELGLHGCVHNASTAPQYVSYWSSCPAKSVESLLALESQRLIDPLSGVSKATFDGVRGVVRAEQRYRGAGMPMDTVSAVLGASLPEEHELSALGSQRTEHLETLTLAQAERFTTQNYRPERATLLVSGNVGGPVDASLDRVIATLPPALTDAPKAGPIERSFPTVGQHAVPLPLRSKAPVVLKGATNTRLLLLAWTVPGAWKALDSSLQDLPGMLEENAFPQGKRWSSSAVMSCDLLPGPTLSIVYCATPLTPDQDRDALAKRLVRQTYRVRGSEARNQTLQTAMFRSQSIKWDVLIKAEDLVHQAGRSESVALHSHMTGHSDWIGDSTRVAQRWDWAQSEKLAANDLPPDRAVVVHVEPDLDRDPAVSTDTHASNLAGLSDVGAPDDLSAWLVKESALDLDTRKMAIETLPNGLTIVALQHHSLPGWVSAGLAFKVGDAAPLDEITTMVNGFLSQFGTPFFGLEYHMDGSGWDGRMHTGIVKQLPELVNALMPDPMHMSRRFDRKLVEFADELNHRETPALWRDAFKDELPRIAIRDLDRTPEPRAFEQAANNRHRPDNAVLVIVGHISPDDAMAMAKRSKLSSWTPSPGSTQTPPATVIPPGPARSLVFVRDAATVQSNMRWTCRLPLVKLDQRQALEVGTEWARKHLWVSLRDARGWSYGVAAETDLGPGGDGVLHFSLDAPAANVPQIMQQIQATVESEPSDRELQLIAYQIGLRYPLSTQTHIQLIPVLVDQAVAGSDVEWHSKRRFRLAKVDAEQVQQVFAGCAERTVVEIRGPKADIAAALDKAKIAWEGVEVPTKGHDAEPAR
ncbi:MAG: insulinase family protein [Myxococcota bacterium]